LSDTAHVAVPLRTSVGLLSSRHIRLRPLTEGDRAFVYQLMVSGRSGGRVRFGGATPPPEQVAASLWDSVLAQFLIEGARSGKPLGLVAITTPNFRDGFAYISALGADWAQGRGMVAEGVMLALHYAFMTWPFRKIYMEASEASYAAFGSGLGRFFAEEGRLKHHTFWDGRYMDVAIFAVYRETWAALAPPYLARLGVGC
jgi:RimJ/RimL family protein N-acetyltransferase